MSTGNIATTPRTTGTSPLATKPATPDAAPADGTTATTAVPAAALPVPVAPAAAPASDQVKVAPQTLKAGGTKPLVAYEPGPEELDPSFDTALTGSGVADTAQDLIPEGAGAAAPRGGAGAPRGPNPIAALEGATGATLLGSAAADAVDALDDATPPSVELPGSLGSALTGAAGVLGALDGAGQYSDGQAQFAEGLEAGDTGLMVEGGTQMAVGTTNAVGGTIAAYQGLTGLAANAANMAGAAKSAAFLAGQAAKVAPLAATLGGIGSIASGAYDICQAFDVFGNAGEMKPEEKQHKLINGSLNVIGGACMLVPGGQVIGAAILIGAAVYDNWDSICDGANKAADAVGEFAAGAADAVAETAGQVADAVSEVASVAVDKVAEVASAAASKVKSWGASLSSAFSFW